MLVGNRDVEEIADPSGCSETIGCGEFAATGRTSEPETILNELEDVTDLNKAPPKYETSADNL